MGAHGAGPPFMYYDLKQHQGVWWLLCKEGRRGAWAPYTDVRGCPKHFEEKSDGQMELKILRALYGEKQGVRPGRTGEEQREYDSDELPSS